MEAPWDGDIANAYGRRETEFGGVHVDGDTLVVMFTGNLDHHHTRLLRLLERPDRLRVELADRPYSEVEAANDRVHRILMLNTRRHHVVGVGIGMHNGQFAIHVSAAELTESSAAAIRAAVAPEEVTLTVRGRARRC